MKQASAPDQTQQFRHYDALTMFLHWATALLVLFQFALGETWGLPTKPVHHLMVVAHLTAGIVLSVVVFVRLYWRLTGGRRLAFLLSPLDRLCAVAMESVLYGLLVTEAGLGFAWRWGAGQSMSFFGFLIPPPFTRFSSGTLKWVENLHSWNAWLIIALAVGHAGAALFHQFILKDGVLSRMLPERSVNP
ncbi:MULTISPECIES: cytochrome b [Acetobacteraceae]|jgi:cytochrome b561|uniref:Cytochrome b561 n=1 Tax=Acetobacter lovaniensis TaxID=104100 RepID=A0A841QF54_9PROT|nr:MULTISPECIES: cytochrome b/b6 domain-containing protein [Acetobacter]MBB6457015.1 cytochrome b561 [Acetobacter lovaniensis]MCP1216657.1 cytochrome b/b6 domain-containing protein [Acetobacter orientalis]MCP1219587.1 cytochrome b/b6 domain-containing protein [Acetobacter orientalis]NHN81004.1 cytochrome b [Acetobacter lovaniensis]GBQ69497.1 cytochrome B561 [Acetobacter lovaniensis NRIC 0474]